MAANPGCYGAKQQKTVTGILHFLVNYAFLQKTATRTPYLNYLFNLRAKKENTFFFKAT